MHHLRRSAGHGDRPVRARCAQRSPHDAARVPACELRRSLPHPDAFLACAASPPPACASSSPWRTRCVQGCCKSVAHTVQRKRRWFTRLTCAALRACLAGLCAVLPGAGVAGHRRALGADVRVAAEPRGEPQGRRRRQVGAAAPLLHQAHLHGHALRRRRGLLHGATPAALHLRASPLSCCATRHFLANLG